ncbi:MAG: hypothetical protein IPI78_05000 [Chitinophagaceae bacterium]|nr:hypothetical protein [Chitinophagaceae bacterium]
MALSNNQSPQSIFTSTQDEINIVASTTYEFEAQYIITGIGGSGKTISTLFALGGGASVTNITYTATSVASVAVPRL